MEGTSDWSTWTTLVNSKYYNILCLHNIYISDFRHSIVIIYQNLPIKSPLKVNVYTNYIWRVFEIFCMAPKDPNFFAQRSAVHHQFLWLKGHAVHQCSPRDLCSCSAVHHHPHPCGLHYDATEREVGEPSFQAAEGDQWGMYILCSNLINDAGRCWPIPYIAFLDTKLCIAISLIKFASNSTNLFKVLTIWS